MKLLWICFIALFSCSLFARPLVIKDINKPIVISKKNPEFVISLPANSTTGYCWVLNGDYNANLITPVKHYYKASNKKLIGAPGKDVWLFTVNPIALKVPTTFSITLIYIRPWELHPVKSVTLQVVTE